MDSWIAQAITVKYIQIKAHQINTSEQKKKNSHETEY